MRFVMITSVIIHGLNILLLFKNGVFGENLKNIAIKEESNNQRPTIATSFDDFTSFVRDSDVIVDKSMIINHFLRFHEGDNILITCPRGTGKTVILNMIATFLSMEVDDNGKMKIPSQGTLNYRLFANGEYLLKDQRTVKRLKNPLRISQEKYLMTNYLGQRPVIRLNFGVLRGNTYESILRGVKIALSEAFKPHRYMLRVMDKRIAKDKTIQNVEDKCYFKRILEHKEEEERKLINAVVFLTEILRKHFHHRVYIFIDDFDAGFNELYLNPEASDEDKENFLEFFNRFMSANFKLNVHVVSSFFTGVTGLIDESLNLRLFDCKEDDVYQYYGISEHELNELFQATAVPSTERDNVLSWYGGYRAGLLKEVKVLRTQSIARFIESRKIDCYWIDRPVFEDFIKAALQNPIFRGALGDFLYNNSVQVKISESNFSQEQYNDLSNVMIPFEVSLTEVFRFLYLCGYLEVEEMPENLDNVYAMKFPNLEIITAISRHIEIFYVEVLEPENGDFSIYDHMQNDYATFLFDENKSCTKLAERLEQYLQNLPKFIEKLANVVGRNVMSRNEIALSIIIDFLTFKLKSSAQGSETFIKRINVNDQLNLAFFSKNKIAVVELNMEMEKKTIGKELTDLKNYTLIFKEKITVIKYIFFGFAADLHKKVQIEARVRKL